MDYIYGNIDPGNVDYTGITSGTADIIVDNSSRTIQCNVHDDVGFDVRKTLPKDKEGNYISGEYTLVVKILNNVPSFIWVPVGEGHIYCGVTDADTIDISTIAQFADVGSSKQNVEYTFEPFKQRSVIVYPESFGPLSSIRHKETGLEVLSGWQITKTVLNDRSYYVYSTAKSTGTYTYMFTY